LATTTIELTLPSGWRPRPYQKDLWVYLERGGKRADVAAHRRWGKDEVALHWTALQTINRPGLYWHMLPEAGQGRRAVCAGSPRNLSVAAPHIEMPELAERPCRLDTLPASPTLSDLEISYAQRGADLVACEAARKLAVDTFEAQSALTKKMSKPVRRWWIGSSRND